MFVLKYVNLDKFEARSTDGVFLGHLAHSHDHRETYEITFDEASPCTSLSDAGTRLVHTQILG
jgi:hypothetical protein